MTDDDLEDFEREIIAAGGHWNNHRLMVHGQKFETKEEWEQFKRDGYIASQYPCTIECPDGKHRRFMTREDHESWDRGYYGS